jgi:hypothetical protein
VVEQVVLQQELLVVLVVEVDTIMEVLEDLGLAEREIHLQHHHHKEILVDLDIGLVD